jgi:hypothetical protein
MQGDTAIGRLGGLLVLGDAISKEQWAKLFAVPADPVASGEVYKRLGTETDKPLAIAAFNVREFVRAQEQKLKFQLEEAKKNADAAAGDPDPNKAGQEQWKVLRAQAKVGSFQLWKNLFGLESLGVAGAYTHMTTSERTGKSGMHCLVQVKDPIPASLKLLLDSGHALEAPSVVKPDTMCLMLRVGADRMLYTALTAIGEDKAQATTKWLDDLKTNMGVDVPALLPHLAGDIYAFQDMVKEKQTISTYAPPDGSGEEPKQITKEIDVVLPQYLFLIGLKDGKAFSDLLSTTVAAVSASPKGAPWVKKKTYQETDVYLVGQGVSEEGADPNGRTSFAVVVVDRYLSFGTWKDVTAVIRKARASTTEEARALAEAVATHPGSNLIFAVPNSFLKKVQKLNAEQAAGGDPSKMPTGPFDILLKMLDSAPLPIGDETLRKKVKDELTALIGAFTTLSEKAQDISPKMSVAHGRLNNGFYELKTDQEVRKPE